MSVWSKIWDRLDTSRMMFQLGFIMLGLAVLALWDPDRAYNSFARIFYAADTEE